LKGTGFSPSVEASKSAALAAEGNHASSQRTSHEKRTELLCKFSDD
jgi:hypothetical protein